MTHRGITSAVLMAIAVSSAAQTSERPLILVQRQAYVMGTRVELSAFAPDRAGGLKRLEAALASLEATDNELSTWKNDSDISAINRTPIGTAHSVSAPLCRVFIDLHEWQDATGGSFDPAIGALTNAWGIHNDGRVPGSPELQTARKRSGLPLFNFDRDGCSVTRRSDATIDVGGFGKGEALDRAAAVLGSDPWMIDFGGQVSVRGIPPGRQGWELAIAHPRDRTHGVMTVNLKTGSLSTSAGSERDQYANGTRIGHIIDPRTGRPAPYEGSVVVWHDRGLVADILSTALYVMGPGDGLAWAQSRGIAAAYLIPDGTRVRTIATPTFVRLSPTTGPE